MLKSARLNMRLFFDGAMLSYIALFRWLRPMTYLSGVSFVSLDAVEGASSGGGIPPSRSRSIACSHPIVWAIRSRSRTARAGPFPPVDTATVMSPSRWIAGAMKWQCAVSSIALRSTFCFSASSQIFALTERT